MKISTDMTVTELVELAGCDLGMVTEVRLSATELHVTTLVRRESDGSGLHQARFIPVNVSMGPRE